MLIGGENSGRFWTLDASGNPVDWIAKGNGWTTSKASSQDWGWNATWGAAVSNAWIRFDKDWWTKLYPFPEWYINYRHLHHR